MSSNKKNEKGKVSAPDLVHDPSVGESPAGEDSTDESERERSFSRRALVRAGWSAPVIISVTPSRVYAQSHVDNGHVDLF